MNNYGYNNTPTPGQPTGGNYRPVGGPGKGSNPMEAKKEQAIENIRNAISELDFKNYKSAEALLAQALNILNEIQ